MNRTYALLAASLIVIAPAFAAPANAATRDEQTKACRGDAMHFCAAEIPNKEKITACMKQHVDELSPACRAMFKGHDKAGDKRDSQ
ncbi:hypothetical protein DR64_7070 [Paraburkholderia xenovorans LB400]|jgi:hypothetical protein|uniref:hypothetical protein n=1 Tax=Paraburkholderia xenovorans TaxID=36873 RepID=UPI000037D976|nr:hypothetical protein [Paraburkholderia xenovorans]AIP37497.1 hypothetical protein DR64_7070 [Paraburkholderia xenovorans LB400]NPT39145.1 hypothetical protein [Paraburkholderia xenovorans]